MTQKDYDLLCKGFILGFLASFDGWNGQVFQEWDRHPTDSEIFQATMQEIIFAAVFIEDVKKPKEVLLN